ncbi:Dirigent protein [Psidium guajava]|nr:Dirigent protein [Psidium guajava]
MGKKEATLIPTEPVTQTMGTGKVSLKLLIDKSRRTVLFAEAGKDFVDFLFHILALPVGQVIQILTETGTMGSLGNLYGSVEKLSNAFIKSSEKDVILKPKAPASFFKIPFLLFDAPPSSDSTLKTYYGCPAYCYGCYLSESPSVKCPACMQPMGQICTLIKPPAGERTAGSDGKGGFVLGEVMYMVTDDLTVEPMSTISSITLLKKFNVEEIGHLEEKVVSFGMDEVIKLLRISFHSEKVLTDVFLSGKRERS